MYNRLLNVYINSTEKMFYTGFIVGLYTNTYKYNTKPLLLFNKCVYTGFLYAVYPITLPYMTYNIYKTYNKEKSKKSN